MATFGNLHNDHKDSDIFSSSTPKPKKKTTTNNDQVKKYQAEPGVIPGQRPAPWLGRHIFGVLATTSTLLLVALLAYKFASS